MAAEAQALVIFYAREKFYRHAQAVCNDALKKRDDPVLIFWKAFCVMQEGNIAEGMRELESISSKRDVQLAVTSALIGGHKSFARVDEDAIKELTAKLKEDLRGCTEKGFLLAAQYHWLQGEQEKAREYVKFVIEHQQAYLPAYVVLGWIDVTSGRQNLVKGSIDNFEKTLVSGNKKEIEALLGKAKFYETQKQYPQALDTFNQIIVLFSWFLPALTEKAKLLIMMGDWDQAYESAQRVVAQDTYNIEALKISIMYNLCRDCKYNVAANKLGDLLQAIDRYEPKNAFLYYSVAKAFSRLAGRNQAVLQQTLTLIERAKQLDANKHQYITEYASQLMMLTNYKTAISTFKQATKMEESNESSLHGLIKCQIMENQFDEAEKTLEFLTEIQNTVGKDPELSYLSALLAARKYDDKDKALKNLSECVDLHFKTLQDLPMSVEYFSRFNADFLLEVAKEYLNHAPLDPIDQNELAPFAIIEAIKILEMILKVVPGQLECFFLLGKCKYLINDDEGSQRSIEQCFKLNASFHEAHLLMAQVYVKQEKAKLAMQSLDQALSHSFEVRDSVFYHFIKAKAHELIGEYEDALKILEAALLLPSMKNNTKPELKSTTDFDNKLNSTSSYPSKFTHLYDRVSIFLQLASVYHKLFQPKEAQRVLEEAMSECRGTNEEVRILIANSSFALKRGDTDLAIAILNSATSQMAERSSSYYLKAQKMMADIYLHYRNEKRQYIDCFKKLEELQPSVQSSLLLGDAYMRIQEPEQAIKVYQESLEQFPNHISLASKIGRALITTHDYSKAISYYEKAVKVHENNFQLRHELAELYTRLKKFDLAEKLLKETLGELRDTQQDITLAVSDVKIYILMAKVHTGSGATAKAVEALQKARDLQINILGRIKNEQPDFIRTQKKTTAFICFHLAEHFNKMNSQEKAQNFYQEALKHDETHEQSILALAKLYLAKGELDSCQLQCIALLRVDSSNEEASMMLADLMFRKNEYEAATFHFQQLLEKNPRQYLALSRLIQLLRRAGKLSEVPKFLQTAERGARKASMEPGLHYCKGLYHRFANNPREALTEFYAARKDSEWGERVLIHMIEIYLNPDNDTFSEQSENVDDKEYMKGVNSAKELLKELAAITSQSNSTPMKHAVLEAYAQMASKKKEEVEAALERLIQIVNADRNYVPALLGVAHANMIRKEVPKARNQLKRISKMQYDSEAAEEFERSWLLLADIYIQAGKFDLAQELLKRCLNYNKSCAKAWEFLGFIMEKEQSYRDAADNYECAWKMENESNPGIGYRLAFNYLKAKRHVEAIDVCHRVLALHPDYPKIRKEVLERARASLRT